MSTVEDQLRAAGRAVTEQVTSLPELNLTQAPARRSLPWARSGRRWATWGAPLTAMALVVAVAVALVAVRGPGGNSAVPPGGTGIQGISQQAPRYYIASDPVTQTVIGDSRTGKVVAVIKPAAGHLIQGVTGTPDGSAFIIDMPQKGTLGTVSGGHEFYLYRAAKPGDAPLQRSPLTLQPSLAREAIMGFALSPDGSRLAVLSWATYEEVLRVYSVATGTVEGQWTMAQPSHLYLGNDDNSHSLNWTGNGQEVAFRRDINLAGGEIGVSVFILNVTRPGHDLRADSRIVKVQSTDNQCYDMLVTPDGKTVVCGVKSFGGAAASCPKIRPGITEYSAATGKLVRVLYTYGGACTWGVTHVYWSDQSGANVVADIQVGTTSTQASGRHVSVAGRFSAHGVTKLSLHLPGDIMAVLNDLTMVAF